VRLINRFSAYCGPDRYANLLSRHPRRDGPAMLAVEIGPDFL
jgi:hypothetical protein